MCHLYAIFRTIPLNLLSATILFDDRGSYHLRIWPKSLSPLPILYKTCILHLNSVKCVSYGISCTANKRKTAQASDIPSSNYCRWTPFGRLFTVNDIRFYHVKLVFVAGAFTYITLINLWSFLYKSLCFFVSHSIYHYSFAKIINFHCCMSQSWEAAFMDRRHIEELLESMITVTRFRHNGIAYDCLLKNGMKCVGVFQGLLLLIHVQLLLWKYIHYFCLCIS